MKKLLISFMLLLSTLVSANAMNSRDARRAALFLTDKMAYELNLSMEQYQSVFEINFDYFLNVDSYDDMDGVYWSRRNLDLSYILGRAAYLRFTAASYFYRPVYWRNNGFTLRIYSRYADRNRFYYDRPRYCMVYNGEHSWRANNGRSYYRGNAWGHYKKDRYDYDNRRDNRFYNEGNRHRDRYDDDGYYRGHGNKHFDKDHFDRGRWGKGEKEHGHHGRH